MEWHIKNGLTMADFEQMALLEQRFYGSEFVTPPAEAYAWYARYPYTTVAAADKSAIAGFVNLFPVKDGLFLSLCAGTFNDRALTAEGIVDIDRPEPAALQMFLCCILVDAPYRGTGLTRALLRAAVRQYAGVSGRCGRIVTDNVTKAGERFSQRYGFSFLCESDHGSRVYAQDYRAFENHVNGE